MFVLWDVLERHYLPNLSIGMRHTLLTLQAGVVTAGAGALVYILMRRQQGRLSTTAEQLTALLERYQQDSANPGRFENPNRVWCRDVLDCNRRDCPSYEGPQEPCWQIVALAGASRGVDAPPVDITRCHECPVYRQSCPDRLTELGEAFNNLMFLLGEESKRVAQMRARMVEREKMSAIGQMAAGIAHEVGNPLSSISSVVQMLKRSRSLTGQAEQLDLIEKHIQRISSTVRQLVSLARPTPETWERTDLGQTLAEAVRLVSFDRRARTVKIVYEPGKSLPTTYALQGQLQQVIINLALNALDAMGDGGTLTIRASKERRNLVVRVTDTGSGISPALGRRVFEPFFTTKEPGRGTGLGLSVSYGIVQKHGGTIDFSSSPGAGTTFTVTLPILNEPPEGDHGRNHRTAGRR